MCDRTPIKILHICVLPRLRDLAKISLIGFFKSWQLCDILDPMVAPRHGRGTSKASISARSSNNHSSTGCNSNSTEAADAPAVGSPGVTWVEDSHPVGPRRPDGASRGLGGTRPDPAADDAAEQLATFRTGALTPSSSWSREPTPIDRFFVQIAARFLAFRIRLFSPHRRHRSTLCSSSPSGISCTP
jgi:hypothetical protein